MSKKIFILAGIVVMIWTAFAFAEPVAPLLPYNDMGKQMMAAQGKSRADAQKEVPTKAEVGLPVYPGSYAGSAGTSNGELSSMQLASKDSPEKVIQWYKENLGKEWKYMPEFATKQIGEVGVFVKTDKDNISGIEALKYLQIRIAKVEKPDDTGFLAMAFDVTGIKSTINMQIKPFM